MSGYLDTRQMIIDTLMGRPEGTQIQPEDHQAYALNMLNYIRSIELSSGSTLTGIAETDTVPIEPLDSRVAYIGNVSQNSVETFTYFKNENNQPITITTTNTSAFVIFMWNTQYWEYQILPISVLQNNSFVGYFICSSNADSDKQITCNINEITINMRILVLMENVNTKNNVTLQINSTTAKPLYYNGQQVSSTNTWDAGEILDIYFDGTNYQSISIKDKALYNLIESVNVGSQSSAIDAFNFVPSNLRKLGLKVTYYDTVNTKWVTKQYIGSDLSGWNTESNWNSVNKFASGQEVNDTGIKDLNGNNDSNATGVLSAEAGKIIGDRVFGESTKAVYTPVSGYVVGRTGAVAASSSGAEYCEVELDEDVHDVKFYGVVLRVGASGVTSGYAFGHYTDPSDTSTWVSDYASEWDYEGSANGLKSYVVHKPSMATHFRTCCKLSVAGGAVVLDDANFYLYLQTGYPLVDKAQLDAIIVEVNGTAQKMTMDMIAGAPTIQAVLFVNSIQTYTNTSGTGASAKCYEIDLDALRERYGGGKMVVKIVAGSDSCYFCFTTAKVDDSVAQTITGATIKAKCGVPTGDSAYRTGLLNSERSVEVTDDAKYLYISKIGTSAGSKLSPQSAILIVDVRFGKLGNDIARASEDNVNLEVDFVDGLAKITHYTGNNAVVADGMTLTDIFETNNMAPIYPGFDNGSFAPMVKGNGTPYVTSEMSVTGRYSLKSNDVNGVKSSQIHTQRNITPALQVFVACKINVTSYTAGRYGINAGTYAQVYKDAITDGWETISDIITTGTGTYLFFGGWSSSEGVCYIDSPVVIDLSIFAETPTAEQLTGWYEQYIAYKQTLQEIPLGSSEDVEYSDEDGRARFVQEMNARAARIGMSNTTFITASGFSDGNGNYPVGTARDYIKLMLEAMSHPTLMKTWGKATWTIPFYDASAGSDATESLLSSVVNPLDYEAGSTPRAELPDLLAAYNILGGKTGTTGVTGVLQSGTYVHNLCVVAEKNGRYVIAVVFGADYVGSTYGDRRFGRMKVLLDNAFGLLNDSSYITQTVLTEPSGSGIPNPYPCSCAAIEVPNIEPSMLQDFTPTLLYSENPDRQVYLASTSKIMTCLLVEEILPLWQKLLYKTIDDVGGSSDILDNGDIATVEDMMMAAMLPSSNGCANCLGRVAGKVLLQRENSTKVV